MTRNDNHLVLLDVTSFGADEITGRKSRAGENATEIYEVIRTIGEECEMTEFSTAQDELCHG
jgi:hypothetical protein